LTFNASGVFCTDLDPLERTSSRVPYTPRLSYITQIGEKLYPYIYIYNYNINITAGSYVSTCLFSILKVEISINYDETGVKFPLVAARELQILRE
jgi:hypothetical protein